MFERRKIPIIEEIDERQFSNTTQAGEGEVEIVSKGRKFFLLKRGSGLLFSLLFVALLASGGAAFYFYSEAESLRANPQAAADADIAKLIARVGELIVLPNEAPTVATVVQPEQLKDQPFFANAKQGDRVLLFPISRKAILYDPDNHKIVEVAPVDIPALQEEEGVRGAAEGSEALEQEEAP